MRIDQRRLSPLVARQLSRAMTRQVALFGDGSDAGGKNRMAAAQRAVFRRLTHRKSSQNAPRPASWRAPERSLGKQASTSVAKSDAVLSGRSLWLKRWSLHTEKANPRRPAGGGSNGGHFWGYRWARYTFFEIRFEICAARAAPKILRDLRRPEITRVLSRTRHPWRMAPHDSALARRAVSTTLDGGAHPSRRSFTKR